MIICEKSSKLKLLVCNLERLNIWIYSICQRVLNWFRSHSIFISVSLLSVEFSQMSQLVNSDRFSWYYSNLFVNATLWMLNVFTVKSYQNWEHVKKNCIPKDIFVSMCTFPTDDIYKNQLNCKKLIVNNNLNKVCIISFFALHRSKTDSQLALICLFIVGSEAKAWLHFCTKFFDVHGAFRISNLSLWKNF